MKLTLRERDGNSELCPSFFKYLHFNIQIFQIPIKTPSENAFITPRKIPKPSRGFKNFESFYLHIARTHSNHTLHTHSKHLIGCKALPISKEYFLSILICMCGVRAECMRKSSCWGCVLLRVHYFN